MELVTTVHLLPAILLSDLNTYPCKLNWLYLVIRVKLSGIIALHLIQKLFLGTRMRAPCKRYLKSSGIV